MKTKLFILAVVMIATISSCKKPVDLSANWVGTYNGTANSNTFNQVVITKVDNDIIKLELKGLTLGITYSYATIGNGKLSSNNTVAVSEDGTVTGTSGTWHFTGAGSLSGTTLTLNGTATQTGQSTLYYTFTGSR